MQPLLTTVRALFEQAGYGPAGAVAALLLGVFSAAASVCCTLPLIGIVAGYSIARKEERRTILRTSFLFMGGIVITLVVIGGLVAFAGHTIQKASGGYWKIVAGSAAILFGIGALELFPFSLPKIKFPRFLRSAGAIGPGVSGIVFGGAVAVSSLPCNPGIFIILGVAVLQHHILWALVTLISYAIGFSIPLSFLVFGFSLGKNLVKIQKVEKLIRTTAGILLIIAGIYLFYTL